MPGCGRLERRRAWLLYRLRLDEAPELFHVTDRQPIRHVVVPDQRLAADRSVFGPTCDFFGGQLAVLAFTVVDCPQHRVFGLEGRDGLATRTRYGREGRRLFGATRRRRFHHRRCRSADLGPSTRSGLGDVRPPAPRPDAAGFKASARRLLVSGCANAEEGFRFLSSAPASARKARVAAGLVGDEISP